MSIVSQGPKRQGVLHHVQRLLALWAQAFNSDSGACVDLGKRWHTRSEPLTQPLLRRCVALSCYFGLSTGRFLVRGLHSSQQP